MLRLPPKRQRHRKNDNRCATVAELLLLLLLVGGVCCQDQDVTAHNHPINETLGSNVTLNCCPRDPRPVDWHVLHPTSMTITVCAMGHVAEGLRHKLFLDTASDPGCYHLVIYNLANADDGVYQCIENGGLGRTTITYQVETERSLSLAGDQSTSTTLNSICQTDKEVCQHRTRGLLIGLIVTSAGVLVAILGLILIYGVCRHRKKPTCEHPKDALQDEQHEFVKRPVTANGVNSAAEKPNGQIVRFTTPATDVHSEPV